MASRTHKLQLTQILLLYVLQPIARSSFCAYNIRHIYDFLEVCGRLLSLSKFRMVMLYCKTCPIDAGGDWCFSHYAGKHASHAHFAVPKWMAPIVAALPCMVA